MLKKTFFPLVLIFVALVPMLLLRDFTPSNELRYLSIADEALRSGHWFCFTNHGVPYCDKPPLYLWIVMLGRHWFGGHCMFFVALFSVIPALLTVAVMQRWCRRELGTSALMAAPWILMSTVYFLGTAVVLRMDMLMCLFITLALYTFYKWHTGIGNPRLHRWTFPIFIFLGIFTKAFMGFLIPFVSILIFLIYKREARFFLRYWGWRTWTILLLGLGVWFGLVYAEGGSEYLYQLAVGQAVNRSVNVSVHKQPFYYYAIAITYSIAPWTLFCLGTLLAGLKRRRLENDMQRLFLIIVASTFVLLSCFGSKLQVYLVPTFPFLIYLTLLLSRRFAWNGWLAFSAALPAMLLLFALPAYIYAIAKGICPYRSVWLGLAAALLSAFAVVSLLYIYRKKKIYHGMRWMSTGLFAALMVGSLALPTLNGELGYTQMASMAKEQATRSHAKGISTYKVRRAENMDAYFEQPVVILQEDELTSPASQQSLLIAPAKCLSDTFFTKRTKGRKVEKIGKFVLFLPIRQ